MKVNLAVYTAQEGYSWQPGTAFSQEELSEFKKCIGKFPSPDASDGLPFGGVFLLDDRVVFYRYHVAKKIDFRGRDALYCVLGAVPRDDAAKIDPSALFASPEFAGPMKPFPTSLELQEADPSAVPEWLKGLEGMALDVRISGPADTPRYSVTRTPLPVSRPSEQGPQAGGDPGLDAIGHPHHGVARPWCGPCSGLSAAARRRRILRVAAIALLAVILAVAIVACFARGAGPRSKNPDKGTNDVSRVKVGLTTGESAKPKAAEAVPEPAQERQK